VFAGARDLRDIPAGLPSNTTIASGLQSYLRFLSETRYHLGGDKMICPRRWQFDGGQMLQIWVGGAATYM